MTTATFLDPHSAAEASAWQALWQRAANRTPFTHLAFVEAIAEATGRRPSLAVAERDGQLVAGAVLFSHPRRTWLAAPAPLTRYTGVLLDPPIEERHVPGQKTPLDALLALVAHRFPVASLTLAPDLGDVRPFQWQGFDCTPRYTYRIDADAPYAPNRLVRRQLRAAAPVAVHPGSPEDAAFVQLLDRHNTVEGRTPPIGHAAHAQLLHALAEAGLLRNHALRSAEGALLAAATTLVDADTTYMWTAGSEPGPAMAALQHHLIEQARAENRAVDLLGANRASIAQFKSHFRGRLVPHYHAVRYRHRWLRALSVLRPLA